MLHVEACSSTEPTPKLHCQDQTNLEQEAFREQNREQKILVEVTASHQQTTHLVETDLLAANANDEAKSITIAYSM
jgi:hypothetical protein